MNSEFSVTYFFCNDIAVNDLYIFNPSEEQYPFL